jgi:hypothetical protein
MNFLIFILFLMTAFSFYYSFTLQEVKALSRRLTLMQTQSQMHQLLFKSINETYFYYLEGKIKKPKGTEYINHRLNDDDYERGKCNIYACLTSKENEFLLKKLLMSLYPELFGDEIQCQALIDHFKMLEKKFSPPDLYHLKPELAELALIYEKLLSTPTFRFLFLYDRKAHQKPLTFRFAKQALFNAALGPELAHSVLKQEKEHFEKTRKKLTRDEVKAALSLAGVDESLISQILNFFAFKEPNKRWIHVKSIDPATGLSLDRLMPIDAHRKEIPSQNKTPSLPEN